MAAGDFFSRRALGMRYLGQSWEIDVEVPPEMATVEALEAAFHDTHDGGSGTATTARPRCVSFRLTGIGREAKPAFGAWNVAGDVAGARIETRAVFFADRFFDTPGAGSEPAAGRGRARGPAIVEEDGAHHGGARPIGASGSSNRET